MNNTADLDNPFVLNGSSYDGKALNSTWPYCCGEYMTRGFYSIGTYPNTEEELFYCEKCHKFIERKGGVK